MNEANLRAEVVSVSTILTRYEDWRKTHNEVKLSQQDGPTKQWEIRVNGGLVRTFSSVDRDSAVAYGEGIADAIEAARCAMVTTRKATT